MRIRDLQENARALSSKHGWQEDASERFSRMLGEVEELRQELLATPVDAKRVAFEIYDVVWNACELGNQLGIELEPFFAEKEALNATRTWSDRPGTVEKSS